MRAVGRIWLGLVVAATATGCAWVDRAHRPVWNTFEEHLVPEDEGWFVAALPMTVPAGITAAAVDAFISQPVLSFDDALDDAASVWDYGEDAFTKAYYTESIKVPVRAVGTPVVFAGSWLIRSMFRMGAREPAPPAGEDTPGQNDFSPHPRGGFSPGPGIVQGQRLAAEWVAQLEAGTPPPTDIGFIDPQFWPEDLRRRIPPLLQRKDQPLVRFSVWKLALEAPWLVPELEDLGGLRDPEPGVRLLLLYAFTGQIMSGRIFLPEDLHQALRQDPDPTVRAVYQQLLRSAPRD